MHAGSMPFNAAAAWRGMAVLLAAWRGMAVLLAAWRGMAVLLAACLHCTPHAAQPGGHHEVRIMCALGVPPPSHRPGLSMTAAAAAADSALLPKR